MKEVVIRNNSQTSVELPIYDRVVKEVEVKSRQTKELAPGEELILGFDLDSTRLDFYKQFGAIDLVVEEREPTTDTPSVSDVPGTDLAKGILADGVYGTQESELISDYEVKGVQQEDQSYVRVVVKGKNLKKHFNGNKQLGYWVGFALKAPEGATHYRYGFGTDQNSLKLSNDKYPLEASVIGEESGVAFYSNLDSETGKAPNNWAKVQWLGESDKVVGKTTDYFINFDEVELFKEVTE